MGEGWVEAKDWSVWNPRAEQSCQCRECQSLITAVQSIATNPVRIVCQSWDHPSMHLDRMTAAFLSWRWWSRSCATQWVNSDLYSFAAGISRKTFFWSLMTLNSLLVSRPNRIGKCCWTKYSLQRDWTRLILQLALVLSAAVDACEVCNEHSVISRVSIYSLSNALCMCYRLSLTYFCISIRISNNMGNYVADFSSASGGTLTGALDPQPLLCSDVTGHQ